MIINHNITALNTYNQLSSANTSAGKSMEKLSSGLRINRAGDDAAGLAISEKMRGQIRGLDQASRNAQDGISMIQTAEGALQESQSILQRMRELTVQANNGTNADEDLQKIQDEIDELVDELDGISERAQFNKQNLLDGSLGAETTASGDAFDFENGGILEITNLNGADLDDFIISAADGAAPAPDEIILTNVNTGESDTINVADHTALTADEQVLNFEKFGITIEAKHQDLSDLAGATPALDGSFTVGTNGTQFQIGANQSQTLSVSIDSMGATDLGNILNMSQINVTDFDNTDFNDQLQAIDEAISQVSAQRSSLGAWQNRLEHTINNLNTSSENLTAAESRIRDVDMAKEMMSFTKDNILSQASTAMLAQANQLPQGVLQLLG
ncbi:flagellin [Chengkuizengella sp. SCS-71B]|uniref:flagellin N-terminal helical domain-containing protein n=1 Tax=Chengkuizengella sp. SCS-71B TaxID=3115290 RepID=UPI0032C24064